MAKKSDESKTGKLPTTPTEKPKVKDMVSAAITAGSDTAKTGVPWIKDTYGYDISPGNFAATKSSLNKGGGSDRSVSQSRVPGRPAQTSAFTTTSLDLVRQVADLVNQNGLDPVREALDLVQAIKGKGQSM